MIMLKKCLLFLCIVVLTACSNQGRIQPRGTNDLIRETWIYQMNINPNVWLKNADPWFLTGEPNLAEQQSATAPLYKAITTSTVRVPDFTQIVVAGDYQVQIVGGQAHNSVYIFGPNADAQHVSVELRDNKLILTQSNKPTGTIRNVIVRIGMRNLRSIENMGTGLVMGRDITSDKLRIIAGGAGSVLLVGNMNLKIVEQQGMGTITVLGAQSPKLNVTALGPGNVNISGRVGIENILHKGNGTVHIVGADTDSLCINTGGNGLTTVYGYVNLKKVFSDNGSRVYVSWVYNQEQLNVMTRGKSIVGIAGGAYNLDVKTFGYSCFLGEYLRAETVYISTKDKSHADITARQKIFATAVNQSGILYYGSPAILTKFVSQQATIFNVGPHQRDLSLIIPKPLRNNTT